MIYVHDLRSSGVVRNAMAIGARLARDRPTTLVAGHRHGLFAEAGRRDGLRIIALSEGPAGRGGRVVAALRLRRYLECQRPAVLLSAGNYGHPTVRLACRGLPAPMRIYRISNEISRAGRLRNAAHKHRLRRLIADAARVAIVGEAIGEQPALAAALRSGRAVVIRNGVDIERARDLANAASPHPWLDDDVPVVLAIGRLHPQKNFGLLIEAFARLRAARPVRLTIIGGGSRERGRLERLADERRVADDILFAGETTNVFAWLARAAVFALPSRWEGSSVALLEALAVGVPVVASHSAGDARLVLDEGRYGALVNGNDPQAFAAAIARQLSPQRVMPGRRADDYALDVMLDRYAALVAEVVAEVGEG